MNHAIKGVIWSGLIFPGLGQIVLKHYKRGIALMGIVLIAMAVIVINATRQALNALDKLSTQGDMVDMDAIFKAASEAATSTSNFMMSAAIILVLICWGISVVDAFIIGRKKDKMQLNGVGDL